MLFRSIEVVVENTEACLRYSGVCIKGVTVKESPEWLQNKLRTIGLRPINNVVDVTNFVLHGMGQPLHSFDADKVKGNKIVVKTRKRGLFSGSGPACFAQIVISLPNLVKTRAMLPQRLNFLALRNSNALPILYLVIICFILCL